MASDQSFVDYIVDQVEYDGEVRSKKMFGEYGIFAGGKMFGLICDNKLFIKPTKGGRNFIDEVVEAPPYPGAKNCFLIEGQIENRSWLSELVSITVQELPMPKRRKKKSK